MSYIPYLDSVQTTCFDHASEACETRYGRSLFVKNTMIIYFDQVYSSQILHYMSIIEAKYVSKVNVNLCTLSYPKDDGSVD